MPQPRDSAPIVACRQRRALQISTISDECTSTDQVLQVWSVNNGDTVGCKFTWKMVWDDGQTEEVSDYGGAANKHLIFKAGHFYEKPRETTIYHVSWDAIRVTGGCSIGSGNGVFILVVPRG